MKEDELTKYLKVANDEIAKHAEVINTLNKNQQVLAKKLDNYEKAEEVNKRVQEIIKQTQTTTAAAETPAPVVPAPAAPVAPVAPANPAPAEPAPAPAEPAKPAETTPEAK